MSSILEILIIVMMPAMVTLMVSIHARAPARSKTLSLTALVFMSLLAGLTCSVHFVVLTLSRQSAFAELSSLPLFHSFKWPSVVFALDILAWDLFFPLSMFFAASTFSGTYLYKFIMFTMITSGALALAGLCGVATNDMQLRNVGIVGYVGIFFIVAFLLAIFFFRAKSDRITNWRLILTAAVDECRHDDQSLDTCDSARGRDRPNSDLAQ